MVASIEKKWRSWALLTLVLGCFLALCYRLVGLTILQGSFLKHQGEIRTSRMVSVAAGRGMIVDRNDKPLAVSLPLSTLWVNPKKIAWHHDQIKKLARVLGVSQSLIHSKVSHKKKGFVYLKRKMSPKQLAGVVALKLPSIHFIQEYRRYYPLAQEAAQMIGITNAKEQGQEGIELAFNEWLKGINGRQLVEQDRMGNIIAIKEVLKSPVIGKPLQLSLDNRIQSIGYESLREGVEKYHADSGSVIVLDVASGEILAMANYPSYNPNNLKRVDFNRLRNRCVTDVFEPGSTMKIFSMISALSSRQYTINSEVDTGNGVMTVHGGHVRDEFLKHGMLSVTNILKKSSNVGIAKITLSLPPERLPTLLREMGFTRLLSGLSGEVRGSMSSRVLVDPFELATLSFGYGVSSTHLQLAHAYAILANYGEDVGIHLTKQKKRPHGMKVFPRVVAEEVIRMLESVVQQGGTATRARIKGVRVAGKTGTAHVAVKGGYDKASYVSSFVGMLPANHPRWVISVVLHNPAKKFHFGGASAAPIFSELGTRLIRLNLTDDRWRV